MKKHTAMEKCRAVLSVWAERRKPADVAQELGIGSSLLSQWQEAGMDGMLAALEPKWREEASCPMLSVKVKKLLERKLAEKDLSSVARRAKEEGRCPRLAKRLAGLAAGVQEG